MQRIFYAGQEMFTIEASLDMLVKAETLLSLYDFKKHFGSNMAEHVFNRFRTNGVLGTYRTLDGNAKKLFLRILESLPDDAKKDYISDAHMSYLTSAMEYNSKGFVISDMQIRDIKSFMKLRYISVLTDAQIVLCKKLRAAFPELDAEVSKEFENKDQD